MDTHDTRHMLTACADLDTPILWLSVMIIPAIKIVFLLIKIFKWSYLGARKVVRKVKGVQSLIFAFLGNNENKKFPDLTYQTPD